jgi:NAD(P)-dependent dehydrogenase (short-subunit alcohol dehydrogenase family)
VQRISFDGQCAIVTGGGRGIGRAYALELASRGAAVVISGITSEGGALRAQRVADENKHMGGRCIAVHSDATSPKDAEQLVQTALSTYGRLDVLVQNAGGTHRSPAAHSGDVASIPPRAFVSGDLAFVERQIKVQLLSVFYIVGPAWEVMHEAGYGRMVLTTSGAVFGHWDVMSYCAAKTGVMNLARSLAIEAEKQGLDIKVNSIAPLAATAEDGDSRRESHQRLNEKLHGRADPAQTAAAVAVLASACCPVNGECIRAGAGYVGRVTLGLTRGWVSPAPLAAAEAIHEHWAEVMRDDGMLIPTRWAEAMEWTVERTAPS